jgi:hypothetical protein
LLPLLDNPDTPGDSQSASRKSGSW